MDSTSTWCVEAAGLVGVSNSTNSVTGYVKKLCRGKRQGIHTVNGQTYGRKYRKRTEVIVKATVSVPPEECVSRM